MTQRQLFVFLLIASVAALGTALIAQYGFNMHPCELCILQRWPYVVVGILASLALLNPRPFFLPLCLLALLIGGGIATYHTGVELGVFPGPTGCSNTLTENASLEDIHKQILNAPLVTCGQAMGYFLGLSFAAWNALASAGLIAITLVWKRRYA